VAFPCVSQNFDSARLFRPYTTQAHRHFFRMSDAAAMWCARRMRAEAVHSARFEAMIEVKAPLTSLNRLLFQQTCQQRSGTYTSMNGRGPRAGRLSKSSVARSAPWTDFGDLYRLLDKTPPSHSRRNEGHPARIGHSGNNRRYESSSQVGLSNE
jgi:hypothetical protein